MKKIYSLFIISLVLYLSVINNNVAYAQVIGDNFHTNLISKEENNETYLNNINLATQCNAELNENTTNKNIDDSTIEVFSYDTQKLYITENDIELMAKLVYAESIGEPYDGKVAVASVVLNRVVNPSFPNSIKEVIFQKNAFSCVKNGDIKATPNQTCYNAVYDAIRGYDPTNEALFFYNPSTATCAWMHQTQKQDMKTIGHHTFFKIKS
ncbi:MULTISPECIES: cell wall hydrolase [unclassified Clostridium]|uniref:cell wall hydrolase n=1 Tax=unclassified Clostridium TaxID=2614128 RepID=UPI002079D7AA|nr:MULTISPECIES: cell wall hydrolase [unclassified Clostridium]